MQNNVSDSKAILQYNRELDLLEYILKQKVTSAEAIFDPSNPLLLNNSVLSPSPSLEENSRDQSPSDEDQENSKLSDQDSRYQE
jgi:hypothetical protein